MASNYFFSTVPSSDARKFIHKANPLLFSTAEIDPTSDDRKKKFQKKNYSFFCAFFGKMNLSQDDLKCLDDGCWFNDEVMNWYMSRLVGTRNELYVIFLVFISY